MPSNKTAIKKIKAQAEKCIYILCIIDEVTNYLITEPIYQSKGEEIGDALMEQVITKYCVPDCIII